MGKSISIEMPTKGLDDLFSTQEQREDENLERVRDIPIDMIDNFPGHPFKVIDDESMGELADSISAHGVQTPIVVRQKEDGRYELISGHRRKRACEIAGVGTIPAIVRVMNRDEAILFMVESNLQRERIYCRRRKHLRTRLNWRR
jgi:ParB family chromosome partitioning protein